MEGLSGALASSVEGLVTWQGIVLARLTRQEQPTDPVSHATLVAMAVIGVLIVH